MLCKFLYIYLHHAYHIWYQQKEGRPNNKLKTKYKHIFISTIFTMKNNNLFRKFLALFLTGTMLAGVGCKYYDYYIDDIN